MWLIDVREKTWDGEEDVVVKLDGDLRVSCFLESLEGRDGGVRYDVQGSRVRHPSIG